MTLDLIDVLARRGIAHPSAIVEVSIRPERMEMRIEGARWWDGASGLGTALLVFEFPQDGCLDLSQFGWSVGDEMLDDFAVTRLADAPWAFEPEVHATYCQAPLRDPLDLFGRVHDWLLDAGAPWGPSAYLNGGPTVAGFRRVAATGNFMLAEAPPALHTLIVEELRRQRVAFSVITHARTPSNALAVRLNGTPFVCRRACVEWDRTPGEAQGAVT